jgi:hypothetical protein
MNQKRISPGNCWMISGLTKTLLTRKNIRTKHSSREAPVKQKDDLAGDLQIVLRDHKGKDTEVVDEGEQRVRESFDQLLEFFTKLEYYLSLKLISKSELNYFEYYISRCYYKANGGVRTFAAAYGYNSLFRLFFVMNTDTKKEDRHSQKPEFTSNAQELYYYDLRNDMPTL